MANYFHILQNVHVVKREWEFNSPPDNKSYNTYGHPLPRLALSDSDYHAHRYGSFYPV